MNFVFLMDPLDTVVPSIDTTLALMVGAHQKAHQVFFLGNGGISKTNAGFIFHVVELVPQLDERSPFIHQKPRALSEQEVDVLFIRTDPPFDASYLHHTWLLDLLPQRILIINSPTGIRTVNEKIWASQFTDLVPRTYIGRNQEMMREFLSKEGDIIAKPTDGHGAQGVFCISQGDTNANVILETLTKDWTRDIILQPYLKEAAQGDKRILLLNGEPLGAILRMHADGDHRNNLAAGGQALLTTINQRDEEIIKALKPHLQRLGLTFVGIDVIGPYLMEVNVTSPTCLQEMNRFYGVRLEEKVICFAEQLIHERRAT